MNMYALVGCIVAGILVVMITAWALKKDLIKQRAEMLTKLINGFEAFLIESYMPETETMTVNITKTLLNETVSTMKKLTEGMNK